jgi:membrane fusion protein (multidrug efflux system)
MVVLSFIGVAYALRTRTGTLPKKVAGVIFDGTCEPSGEIRISSETLGTVAEILVQPGEVVEKGQLLLRMDDKEARASLQQAMLEHTIAEGNLSSVHQRYADAKANLAISQMEAQQLPTRQWRDSPERAAVAYEHALSNYKRAEALFRAGVLAQQDFDERSVELRLAKDDLSNAENLARASTRLQTDQREHAVVESKVNRQELVQALDQATLRLKECERRVADANVRASEKGVVAEVAAHVGDRLSAGVLLVRLAELHRMTVLVPVTAELVSQLRIHQPATIQLPTMPVRTVDGYIRSISPLPSANMTHNVLVEFHNTDISLIAGQPAKVRFSER